MFLISFLLFYFAFGQNFCSADENQLRAWQQMFRLKRSQQLVAVKNLLQTDDHQNRQKTIKLLTEAMQKVMIDSRNQLMKANFEPGMEFPDNNEVKEALSRILENTAFFADLALHLPDYAGKLYKKDMELQNLIRWSIEFSNKTGFFDDSTKELMNLIGQELNLIERQENYQNPYRESFRRETAEAETFSEEKMKKTKPKEKSSTRRGPKMSSRKNEL